jgi:hypothetical protein
MSIASKSSRTQTEIPGMSLAQAVGICSTCVNSETCVMLRNAREPVWFCDEFDDITSIDEGASYRKQDKVIAEAKRIYEGAGIIEKDARGGVCSNCRQAKSCSLSNLETRMFCEEHS